MSIDLKDYHYSLPDERIAKFPLEDRSAAKLLVYQDGEIDHQTFKKLPAYIPSGSLMVFNDTKVIPARIIFHRATGARIEVFLLEPESPSNHEQSMASMEQCSWKCMIGNSKKWKGEELTIVEIGLKATRTGDIVQFRWSDDLSFSEILEQAGKIPLPPYLNREVTDEDKAHYQTVYSKNEGAVAAPTAGLHFDDQMINSFEAKTIQTDYLTLHVSAGTFQPIKADSVHEHEMHKEQVIVSRHNVEKLLSNENVVAVGTTSLRTLESLYWFGVKLLNGEEDFFIPKLYPYQQTESMTKEKSLEAVVNFMDASNTDHLVGQTEIFIFPGYDFKIVNGLVTNFHLPGSTLILLVAAFIGDDWRKVYDQALENDYRFLSYGDGSILLK